jgi:outer membrane protein TolC
MNPMKNTYPAHTGQFARNTGALLAAVLMTGCAVTPVPVSKEEVTERIKGDTQRMYADQVAISGTLSLEDVLARSLKYNLDYRLKRMESALALGLTDFASQDMLPKLLARAGYDERSNDSGGYSMGIIPRVISTDPTTSKERANHQSSLNLSWNALDFGVSYYRAKQQGNQFLIAEERRRKMIHNLLQDVRAAYWRALAAQKLNAQAEEVLQRAQTALSRSREAELQKALSPAVALAYQRALLDATSLLNQRRQDLQYAKQELAALMSVPVGVNFELAQAPEPKLAPMPSNIAKLEELALMQRTELREEDLRKRISADEARKQILSLLPGISFNVARTHDPDRFNYNQSWSNVGVSIAWDVLRLASLPAMKNAQKFQEATDDARRASLSMAVVTQIRLGAERYRMAMQDYELASQAAQVDQRLAQFTRASVSAKLDSELEAIRTQARAVLGAYQQANAYANAQIAYGRLYNALGFDPLADDIDGADLPTLTQRMKSYLQAVDKDAYSVSSQLLGQYASMSVKLEGVDEQSQQIRLTALTKEMLSRNDVVVDSQAERQLVMKAKYMPAEAGMQRLVWTLSFKAGTDGKQAPKEMSFTVLVPSDARDSVLEKALGGALTSRMSEIKLWMDS